MSSSESMSSCSSASESRNLGRIVYNSNHTVDVVHNNGSLQRNLLFTIIGLDNALKIKVRDSLDYIFNYTTLIDWTMFDRMKREQLLDISFEEFQPQILELLKQTASKQMLMRVETCDSQCRVIFYEKSRIKSLIFLTIDLIQTEQKELVEEMATNITQLKDFNKVISTQLALTKNQLRDTESVLKNTLASNGNIGKQFQKDLELILQTFMSHICQTESSISREIAKLTKRHQKVLKDVESLKTENIERCESNRLLSQSLKSVKTEMEGYKRTIEKLQSDNQLLTSLKTNVEQTCVELRASSSSKDVEVENLQKQMSELRRDIQDATMIIAQKTKTNDEIGKDLVQANQVIVNFNTRYDLLFKQNDELKEQLHVKENIIREQAEHIDRVNRESEQYRGIYNAEETKRLQHELLHARHKIEELQKQNSEAVKLNGLLAKKLSALDVVDTRSSRVTPNC